MFNYLKIFEVKFEVKWDMVEGQKIINFGNLFLPMGGAVFRKT